MQRFLKISTMIIGLDFQNQRGKYFKESAPNQTTSLAKTSSNANWSSVNMKISNTSIFYSRQSSQTSYRGEAKVFMNQNLILFSRTLPSTLNSPLRLYFLLQVFLSFLLFSVWVIILTCLLWYFHHYASRKVTDYLLKNGLSEKFAFVAGFLSNFSARLHL